MRNRDDPHNRLKILALFGCSICMAILQGVSRELTNHQFFLVSSLGKIAHPVSNAGW